MIVSEKQIVVMLEILKESIDSMKFSLSQEQRIDLFNKIMNQQSDELKVIE
jgi:hypothetical protein